MIALLAAAALSAQLFANPPRIAAPHVWWHWMNGNVTAEGITADLEAMARVGLAGAQVFDTTGVPKGPVAFDGPEWHRLIVHAHNEAKRLGLQLCVANCSGYSSSGGPWVKPEESMKELAWTETRVAAGAGAVKLARPDDPHGFYRDIAVFALPAPAGSDAAAASLAVETQGGARTFTFSFDEPQRVAGLRYAFQSKGIFWDDGSKAAITVKTPDGRGGWTTLARFDDPPTPRAQVCKLPRYRDFPATTAKVFAVEFRFGSAGDLVQANPVAEALGTFGRLPGYAGKTFASRQKAQSAETNGVIAVRKGDILNLTDRLRADGTLDWTPARGAWTVVRIGYRASGRRCHPATHAGAGLEVDKLDAAVVSRFFDAYVGRLAQECGIDPKSDPLTRTGFNMTLVDSYEVGCQNWTAGFEGTFRERTGYDLVPYLPAMAGFVIDSVAETERVLADFRRVVADRFAECYADELARKCRAAGLLLAIEPYGVAPCDDLRYGREVGAPMSEFWWKPADRTDPENAATVASIAHVRGRKFVGAESFTTFPEDAGWRQVPWDYKAAGDAAYAAGVNRIIYHRFAHQPWTEPARLPGMTMGYWGTHFERTQTWWDFATDWIRYETRCQYLLQEGEIVRDILAYAGSHTPNDGSVGPMPEGYGWDAVDRSSLADLRVEDGRIVAPSGIGYRVLVLPDDDRPLAPERRELDRIAAQGGCVVPRAKLEATLASRGVAPDFTSTDAPVRWIHRRYAGEGRDGFADAYFVATAADEPGEITCSFRESAARIPEIWDPETGETGFAPSGTYRATADGRVEVTFDPGPRGSRFIVFRTANGPVPANAAKAVRADIAVKGPWTVAFQSGRGAPAEARFEKPVSWTERPEPGIRFFSGVATYRTTVRVDPLVRAGADRVTLALGRIGSLARVKANGVAAPLVCWKPPYEADVTAGVKGAKDGAVELEIEVVNTWVNRLIGDQVLYGNDCSWYGDGRLKAFPDYVTENRPASDGRITFTTYRFWTKRDEKRLMPSGLLDEPHLIFR